MKKKAKGNRTAIANGRGEGALTRGAGQLASINSEMAAYFRPAAGKDKGKSEPGKRLSFWILSSDIKVGARAVSGWATCGC